MNQDLKNHINEALKKGIRLDGRKKEEFRKARDGRMVEVPLYGIGLLFRSTLNSPHYRVEN